MNWLLDTHIFLWVLDDSAKLSPRARQMVLAPDARCFVSAISFWEIAIKTGLRRKQFKIDVGKLVTGALAAGLELLPFDPEHAVKVAHLPLHHSDPFDRALVAQAQSTRMTLLTRDAVLERYGKSVRLI